jgi:hypothetical protein
MKHLTIVVLAVLLLAFLTLAGCEMELLGIVKQEVEKFQGSPAIIVMKGIDQVNEGGDVPIGPAIAGNSKLVTFSIENLGASSLQLTGIPRVEIGGPDASQFAINTLPASIISVGGKSDFIIDFSPVGTGQRTATILIENSASDDGSFDFTIIGEGVGSAGPEIQVTTGSTIIDENQPYTHDFGKLLAGDTNDDTFTVYNIGTPASLLQLNNHPNAVQITGTHAGMFSVTVQTDKQWLLEGDPVDDHTSFTVQYQPSAVGTHTATVSILNTDENADEIPYTFDITGHCYQLDVLFIVDVSGSMGAVLSSVKAGISETMIEVEMMDSNAAFALATLNDFPYGSWGTGTEAYDLLQGLTSSQATINTLLASLFAGGGNDFPGSQLEALYQGTTGEGLGPTFFGYVIPASPTGWRSNAMHAIVLLTDSPFHDPEVDVSPQYPGHTFDETIAAMNLNDVGFIGMGLNSGYSMDDMLRISAGTGGPTAYTGGYETGFVLDSLGQLMSQY